MKRERRASRTRARRAGAIGTSVSIVALLGTLVLAGCRDRRGANDFEVPEEDRIGAPRSLRLSAPAEMPGFERVVRIEPWLITGSEPTGATSFETLASLGVTTVVSVDGVEPDVEAARAAGLRVVHLPIGYDGVPPEVERSIARLVAEEVERDGGRLFVHCHHGVHRGPAVAAIAWLAGTGGAPERARGILTHCGTSENYDGLWESVALWTPPSGDLADAPLPEVAEVEDFAAAMARIDRHWDDLKLAREAGWTTPAAHPDIVPRRSAVIVEELFAELARLERDARFDSDETFARSMESSELALRALVEALGRSDARDADVAFERAATECRACHRVHRD